MMIMSQSHATETDVNGRRLCDFCGEAAAVLYCRADSAKLCLACDRQVHSTNQLFAKHARSLLCDSCDSTSATIFCCTHASVLCQNCDWETHTNLSLRAVHDRRPLEGFTGCPSATELLGILGFDEVGKKAPFLFTDDSASAPENDCHNNGKDAENVYGFSDFLVWETPSMVSLDDIIVPRSHDSSSGRAFQAMGVPPLPKNRNATCGQHKAEILFQIREISKLEPNMDGGQVDFEPLGGIPVATAEQNLQYGQKDGSLDHNEQPTLVPSFEANSFGLLGDKADVVDQDVSTTMFGRYIEMSNLVPDKDSEVGDSSGFMNDSHEDHLLPPGTGTGTGTIQVLPRVSIRELNSQERDSAISRYKEKKKNRRYEKHIRYETRKVRAESRTRIRGRFAKVER